MSGYIDVDGDWVGGKIFVGDKIGGKIIHGDKVVARHERKAVKNQCSQCQIENEHLKAIVIDLLDGLSMHRPPAWEVWAANMAADRWIFYGNEWRKDGASVSVFDASEFWRNGETPPVGDK